MRLNFRDIILLLILVVLILIAAQGRGEAALVVGMDGQGVPVLHHPEFAPADPPAVKEHTHPHTHPAPEPAPVPDVWQALAECESHGEWNYGPHSGWGSGIYHGGLQFHPNTWANYRTASEPSLAYEATPAQQIAVAERVKAEQGWGAWPACSRKLGLR